MSQSDPDIAKQSIASKIWAEKYLISPVAIHHFKFGPRLVISKHIMEQINRKDTYSLCILLSEVIISKVYDLCFNP